MRGQRRHGGVVVAERAGCPRHGPGRQHIRGGATSWASLNVVVGQAGSRQRHTRTSYRNSVTRPKQGALCSLRSRRP
jgi:hypothetical protein